jgi:hypothetical protein
LERLTSQGGVVGFPEYVIVNHYQGVGRNDHLTLDGACLGHCNAQGTHDWRPQQISGLVNIRCRDAPANAQ